MVLRPAQKDPEAWAASILLRCREIATYTEIEGETTRRFLSEPMRGVHGLVRGWMEAAGMETRVDAGGNVRGVLRASAPGVPTVVLGSHLDTVPRAGAFDGVLGVVLAIAVVEAVSGRKLPFAIEVIGFSEEEGVRFRSPFLGSLAAIGALDGAMLALVDDAGVSVAEAIRTFGLEPSQLGEASLPSEAVAYLEVHIEQGPVLEALAQERSRGGRVLGVVDAIVGQTRLGVYFAGQSNHAGTTPMHLRRDALAAAAAWVVAVEALAREVAGLVATVGTVQVTGGAANVVAGSVQATLDVRHARDAIREDAVRRLREVAEREGAARGVGVRFETVLEQNAVAMDAGLVSALERAVMRAGHTPHVMASGAGHDAMIVARRVPSVMLFVGTPGGLSHHPDEAVLPEDVEAALESVLEFLGGLSDDKALVADHA